MASLIRPWIVSYLDPNGKKVKKGNPGAKKRRVRAAKWYAQGVPGLPPRKRVPLATDKRVAAKMLADMVGDGERGIANLPARDVAAWLLEPLVVEFGEAVGRRSVDEHTARVLSNVRRFLAGVGAATLSDLHSADLVPRAEKFVWGLLDGPDGLASSTAAYVGKHARQFTRWLWRKRKLLGSDPLAGLDLPSQAATRPRRAFSPEELVQLLTTAETRPRPHYGIAGPDRAALYLLGAATGFRCAELARLTPGHFDLDGDVPMVRLSGRGPAGKTKNGKSADQPLPPVVTDRLRTYLAGRPKTLQLWPGGWARQGAKMIRRDMAAAGIPVLVGDEAADFHSLRHSYTSLLAQVAPVKVTQELARHSTPTLTIGRYAHAGMREKAEAVALLPLPGADVGAGPFASMPRAELENLATVLVLAMAATLGGPTRFAPGLAPGMDSEGEPGRTRETKSTRRATA